MMVDKHTTHTHEEEREAFLVLKGTTRRLVSILRHFKINSVRDYVMRVEKRADEMIASSDREFSIADEPREKITYVCLFRNMLLLIFDHTLGVLRQRLVCCCERM